MHLESFKLFHDLAETKSFTRAAERNNLTQSALSQMLSAMERKLGARLVDRGRNSFQLTAAGEICHDHCREISRLLRDLDHQIQQARTDSGGVIELATCYSIGLHQLPPVLRLFRQNFPNVEFRLRYGLID